jgi:cytoskeletal protein RodZ
MDETDAIDTQTAGERLRAAREEKGLSLEDLATQTRIPRRHLESLETADWERLPAPTYTLGFAKSYASAVGLDRTAIAEQLRAEMGGTRPESSTAEVFQPADPARAMPKWLVFGAIAAVIAIALLFSWFQNRSLTEADEAPAVAQETPVTAPTTPVQPQAQQAAIGPVVLTATEPSWIQVSDNGKTLFQGELAAGQTFAVPVTATAPTLRAGKPESLRITVGNTVAPPVGPPGRVASNVSLLGPDLMKAGGAPGQNTAPAPQPAAR